MEFFRSAVQKSWSAFQCESGREPGFFFKKGGKLPEERILRRVNCRGVDLKRRAAILEKNGIGAD